jgi:hypothetical protein
MTEPADRQQLLTTLTTESLLLTYRWERLLQVRCGEGMETLFPSPQAAD